MNSKQKKPAPKRVFIVDDHPLMRLGLTQFLASTDALAVCGEAANAREAMEGIIEQRPDLIILDISLPGRSGLEIIKELKQRFPAGKILAHSMHDERIYGERAIRAGARGYLMKKDSGTDLLDAIETVLGGRIYRGPNHQGEREPDLTGSAPLVSRLSDRELEVFESIGRGRSNAEIARQLHLSVKTVDAHREHIKRKLGMKTGTELNLFAVRWVAADTTLAGNSENWDR